MAVVVGLLLFALPFLAYAAWWRLSGQGGRVPGVRVLLLGALGVLLALAFALVYGMGRSIEPGQRYVPARIEGGAIAPGGPRGP